MSGVANREGYGDKLVWSNRGRLRFVQIGVVLAATVQLPLAPIASAIMPDISLLRQNQSPKTPDIVTGKKKNTLPAVANTQAPGTKVAGSVPMNNGMATSQEAGDTEPPDNPTATPEAGSYNTSKWVELKAEDDSLPPTKIHYTLDGTDPDGDDTLYRTPILVDNTGTTTIKAIAYDVAMNASAVVSFVYIIDREDPEIEAVQYFDKTGTEINNDTPTNGDVKVRVTASEPSEIITSDPDNPWKEVDDSTFEKVYAQNTTETEVIRVKDEAGNESEPREIAVKGIDTVDPIISFNPQSENNIYNQAVTYSVWDNADNEERRSTVTINGFAAPQSDTISNSGTYTIIVTDTAGNETEEQFFVFIPVATASDPVAILTATTVPDPISPLTMTDPTPVVAFNQVDNTDNTDNEGDGNEGEVLSSVDSTPDTTVAAIAPSSEGWKILGIAWYWVLLALSLVASAWWALTSWYQHRHADEDIDL